MPPMHDAILHYGIMLDCKQFVLRPQHSHVTPKIRLTRANVEHCGSLSKQYIAITNC